jgi:Xaa-Pro aminopeptidase
MRFRLFEPQVYKDRRTSLFNRGLTGVAIFLGNHEAPRNYRDNTYHFRQDSTFLYYFGLPVAGLAAMIDFDNDQTIVFGTELTIDDIVWTGPLPTIGQMSNNVGVHHTASMASLAEMVEKALSGGREIHFLPPYRHDNLIFLSQLLHKPVQEIRNGFSHDFRMAVVNQRNIKEAREIEEIHKASLITSSMHMAAMASGKAGMYEYEVAAKVQEAAIKGGGELSFSTILTVRGETLHNHYHGNILMPGQLVLCDSGAENDMNYCGDMTCTFPVDAHFTTKQAEVYNVVYKAQTECADMLAPGVLYRDIYYHSCRVIIDGMKELGLVTSNIDTEELVQMGAHGMFFQCGLGHMMGLDVHDMEDLGEQYVGYTPDIVRSTQFGMKSLRLARALEPGHVVTVEPGIYFIPTLMDLWRTDAKWKDVFDFDRLDTYKDFGGIRIEEDFAITENGSRLLGQKLPKTITEIEEFRAHLFG